MIEESIFSLSVGVPLEPIILLGHRKGSDFRFTLPHEVHGYDLDILWHGLCRLQKHHSWKKYLRPNVYQLIPKLLKTDFNLPHKVHDSKLLTRFATDTTPRKNSSADKESGANLRSVSSFGSRCPRLRLYFSSSQAWFSCCQETHQSYMKHDRLQLTQMLATYSKSWAKFPKWQRYGCLPFSSVMLVIFSLSYLISPAMVLKPDFAVCL